MHFRRFGAVSITAVLVASCRFDGGDAGPESGGRAHGATASREVPAERQAPPSARDGREVLPEHGHFLGAPEDAFLRSLASEPIAAVRKGRGGRSLGFEITLRDGTRGYFKPEQSFSAAHWWSEVAAYYVDRELGLGRVPPLVGRRFRWDELREAAGADRRVRELAIESDGTLRGAFIHWVEGGLEPLLLPRGWERWVRVRGAPVETPYQRPAEYRAVLRGSRRESLEVFDPRRPDARERPELAARAAELSDLIIFDYLIQNVDRWGGSFTNVRTRGAGGPLVFLDNGAGFWPEPRLPLMEARLKHLERFRRGTVSALERFELRALESRLAEDPLAPVLEPAQLEGLAERVEAVLAHIDRKQRDHGDAVFLD